MSNTNSTLPELVITRTFNAPRELVFQTWTDGDHLAKWWGPKGFSMEHITLDLRPGGIFHYCMRSPAGQEMWGKFTYHEITSPERLVFASAFSDANGGTTGNPFMPVWPAEILNAAVFEEDNGRTKMTVVGKPLNASAEECAAFASMTENMNKGFEGTFEQLDTYLASIAE